jgi:hypothetical protein
VQVLIRMRPLNQRETDLSGNASNLHQLGSSGLHLSVEDREYDFTFDQVIGADGTQEELFKCESSSLSTGYNSFREGHLFVLQCFVGNA